MGLGLLSFVKASYLYRRWGKIKLASAIGTFKTNLALCRPLLEFQEHSLYVHHSIGVCVSL